MTYDDGISYDDERNALYERMRRAADVSLMPSHWPDELALDVRGYILAAIYVSDRKLTAADIRRGQAIWAEMESRDPDVSPDAARYIPEEATA